MFGVEATILTLVFLARLQFGGLHLVRARSFCGEEEFMNEANDVCLRFHREQLPVWCHAVSSSRDRRF